MALESHGEEMRWRDEVGSRDSSRSWRASGFRVERKSLLFNNIPIYGSSF